MNTPFDIAGKVAVVTGGRQGLGRAMAIGLAKAGAHIGIIAKSATAGSICDDLRAINGTDPWYRAADLTIRAQRIGAIDKAVEHFGRIDILINNAGLQRRQPIGDYSSESWDADLSLLLTAPFELSQQAARHMAKAGSGKIIHIASISSFQSARNIVGYAAAKHGLIGLTKSMANEWAPLGINVNAIAPGLFETAMAADTIADQTKAAEMRGRIPAGRFGQPEDIVGPLLFLASDASRHVHGHVLVVDGGWLGR
jgi:2-dehydro-3-deoxy-D-gluconate 5-dehydrogenase